MNFFGKHVSTDLVAQDAGRQGDSDFEQQSVPAIEGAHNGVDFDLGTRDCETGNFEGDEVSRHEIMNPLGPITERAALKAEILAKFVDAVPVAFIVADDQGEIYLVNRQTELLFGYEQSELIGQPVEILIPEGLRQIHIQHREKYVEEPHTRVMCEGLRFSARKKNGTQFPAAITLGPMITTEGLYIVVVVMRRRENPSA